MGWMSGMNEEGRGTVEYWKERYIEWRKERRQQQQGGGGMNDVMVIAGWRSKSPIMACIGWPE